MGAAHRLRALHVRVGRHDRVLELFGLRDDGALERLDPCVDAADGIAGPEAGGGGDLVVAAASGMEARGRIAGGVVEEAVDDGVDVLVRGDRWFTGGESGRDGVESRAHGVALGGGEDPRLGEGEGPAFGELNVEGPEAEIDRDGAVDGFEGRMRPAGKATTPEFVGAAVRGAGGGIVVSVRGGHRIPWACISGT